MARCERIQDNGKQCRRVGHVRFPDGSSYCVAHSGLLFRKHYYWEHREPFYPIVSSQQIMEAYQEYMEVADYQP